MRPRHPDEEVTAGGVAERFLRNLVEEFWRGFRERLRLNIHSPMDFPLKIDATIGQKPSQRPLKKASKILRKLAPETPQMAPGELWETLWQASVTSPRVADLEELTIIRNLASF